MAHFKKQLYRIRRPEDQRIQLFSVLLLFLAFACNNIYAQDDAQYVFASQGNYSESNKMSLSWTLGDSYIKTLGMESMILTQGFQQPFLKIKKIDSARHESFNALVYPNPTAGLLTVENKDSSQPYQIEVYDAVGRLVQKLESNESKTLIDLSIQHAGQYFIRLTNAENSKLSLFEIIKL